MNSTEKLQSSIDIIRNRNQIGHDKYRAHCFHDEVYARKTELE